MERKKKGITFALVLKTASRGGAVVARWAHNPKAGGSIPSPATKSNRQIVGCFLFCVKLNQNILQALNYVLFLHNNKKHIQWKNSKSVS